MEACHQAQESGTWTSLYAGSGAISMLMWLFHHQINDHRMSFLASHLRRARLQRLDVAVFGRFDFWDSVTTHNELARLESVNKQNYNFICLCHTDTVTPELVLVVILH